MKSRIKKKGSKQNNCAKKLNDFFITVKQVMSYLTLNIRTFTPYKRTFRWSLILVINSCSISSLPLFKPFTKNVSALWMQLEYSGRMCERLCPMKGGRIPLKAISWWICLRGKERGREGREDIERHRENEG